MSGLNYDDPYPECSPAVIFLHGLGANSSSWSLQFKPLYENGFRPIAIDLPGFGKSKYTGDGWNFRTMASIVEAFSKRLGLDSFHLVGLSMGGVIAQQFTLDYPKLVNKLVLASTFTTLRPSNVAQLFYFLQRALVVHLVGLDAQSKIVAKRVFPNPGQESLRHLAEQQIRSADPRAYRAAMRNLAVFSSIHRLHEINTPTLVIAGENDTTVPSSRQMELVSRIKGSEFCLIPQAGHAVSIDQFELFNKYLLQFLIS